jgi:glycine reductase complex component B subunit alpha and beta
VRLTLALHPITALQFGESTALEGSTLTVNEEELRAHLLEDGRLESVDFELVAAGKSARIGGVVDVIEPRAKEPGDGSDFPGAVGPIRTAGQGTTHALRGAVVTLLGAGAPGSVIEMTGPWAEWSPFAGHHHIVVIPKPRAGLPPHSASNARIVAALKTSAYLGRCAIGHEPMETEVYESAGPAASSNGALRVAYIGQVHSRQHVAEVDEHIIYGHNTNGMVPAVLHPNEWLDGAVLAGNARMGLQTYFYQNHPILTELFRWQREGRIQLVGTVATMAGSDNVDRDLNCAMAASLAKWTLGADAAILTKVGGGAPHADMGLTAHYCEELGIRTSVMVGPPNLSPERTVESSTLFNYPDVDAIVFNSGGAYDLPAAPVERVVAPDPETVEELQGLDSLPALRVCGVTNQQGAQRLRTFVH